MSNTIITARPNGHLTLDSALLLDQVKLHPPAYGFEALFKHSVYGGHARAELDGPLHKFVHDVVVLRLTGNVTSASVRMSRISLQVE